MATRLDTRTTLAPNLTPGANVFAALLAKARPLVMGVLNVTPDSFSDGGRFLDPQAAIAHARQFVYADGLDVEAPAIAVPVGITCRQCPRENCAERAFDRIELPGVPSQIVG